MWMTNNIWNPQQSKKCWCSSLYFFASQEYIHWSTDHHHPTYIHWSDLQTTIIPHTSTDQIDGPPSSHIHPLIRSTDHHHPTYIHWSDWWTTMIPPSPDQIDGPPWSPDNMDGPHDLTIPRPNWWTTLITPSPDQMNRPPSSHIHAQTRLMDHHHPTYIPRPDG